MHAPLAESLGRFQLGESAGQDDHRSLPDSLRGRAPFESGFGVEDVNQRQTDGWIFRQTKLSQEFRYADAQAKLPESAHMLLLLREGGTMRFFTHASRPEPRAGDIIISFSPPQKITAEQAAAKNAEKRGSKAQTA